MSVPRAARAPRAAALAVIVAGFGFGAATHALDVWRCGWPPYRIDPPALAWFWNALVLLDAAVVALVLAGWRRAGLALGTLVMIGDVAANGYAAHGLGLDGFALALPVQAGFLGFLLGAVPFLWREHRRAGM